MNYTLHQLRIFHSIARNKSITRASEELHLTQPAVSIQLKNFQDQFPLALTEVVGRKLYITDFGKEIAQMAESILYQVEQINYKTEAFKGKIAGRLTITTASTAKYVMPYFLTDFMRENPAVDLTMDVSNKTQVIRSLEKNEVDFAMVSVLPEDLQVNNLELVENKLFLVGSKRRTLPKGKPLKTIFTEQPLLYREEGSATRNAMEEFIKSKNFEVSKKMELTSNEALKQALIAGLGFSIMPLIGIKNELKNKDLQIIPYRGLPMVTSWNLIWLKSKKLSPTAQAYLEYLKHARKDIIDSQFSWYKKY